MLSEVYMQYKNIQIVEGMSPNQNANSYGRNDLIILYGNIFHASKPCHFWIHMLSLDIQLQEYRLIYIITNLVDLFVGGQIEQIFCYVIYCDRNTFKKVLSGRYQFNKKNPQRVILCYYHDDRNL